MKATILLVAIMMSASAFAGSGTDKKWTCRVKGVNTSGQTVKYTFKTTHGGLGYAQKAAIRDCKRNGLTNCNASCNY